MVDENYYDVETPGFFERLDFSKIQWKHLMGVFIIFAAWFFMLKSSVGNISKGDLTSMTVVAGLVLLFSLLSDLSGRGRLRTVEDVEAIVGEFIRFRIHNLRRFGYFIPEGEFIIGPSRLIELEKGGEWIPDYWQNESSVKMVGHEIRKKLFFKVGAYSSDLKVKAVSEHPFPVESPLPIPEPLKPVKASSSL